jgi:thioredoxin reductase (NADPH)
MEQIFDILVVGGGPCGLACAIEATRNNLSHLVLEKGSLTESIRRYPRRMRFFSTAENIEIGGLPFPVSNVKATRDEALQYYRKVTGFYHLNIKLFATVAGIRKEDDGIFRVTTEAGDAYRAHRVVIATGYFDFPRHLHVPGENLPHVSHYYDEPYRYSFTKVVIVGGANSAIEAALELYRHDVDVTLVHRAADFKVSCKYWLIPDVKNRVKEGRIKTLFNTEITAIEPGKVSLRNRATEERSELPADFVLLLTGYVPDSRMLLEAGVHLRDVDMVPTFDPLTFETNVEGLYLAGTVIAGVHTEKIFIENGRDHGKAIIDHILGRPVRKVQELVQRI